MLLLMDKVPKVGRGPYEWSILKVGLAAYFATSITSSHYCVLPPVAREKSCFPFSF